MNTRQPSRKPQSLVTPAAYVKLEPARDAFAVTPQCFANSFRLMDELKGRAMAKNTICLWYDKDAETAARFYAETFPDSAVGAVHRAPSEIPRARRATC